MYKSIHMSIIYSLLSVINPYVLSSVAVHFNILGHAPLHLGIPSHIIWIGKSREPLWLHPRLYGTPSRLVSPCLDDSPQGSQLFWKGTFCVSALLIKPKHTHGTKEKEREESQPFLHLFSWALFWKCRAWRNTAGSIASLKCFSNE